MADCVVARTTASDAAINPSSSAKLRRERFILASWFSDCFVLSEC
jgi:hypothetical protein